MGNTIVIDTNNDGNFTTRKLVDPGIYKLAITPRPLRIELSKSSQKQMIPLELKVLFNGDGTETSFRGQTIYDYLVIDKKSEWKLTHFALSSGAYTREDLKNNGGSIDMDHLSEMEEVTAKIGLDSSTPEGSTVPKIKNVVEQYIFTD